MQKRRLGSTQIDVSVMGLGTVKLGRNQGVNYPHPFELPSDVELDALLSEAAQLGINLLDTAPAYGSSEDRLGKWLRSRRHQWVISSKVGETFENGVSRFDFSPDAVRVSVDNSLRRLQTDYLDIVFVHSNGEDERIIREDQVFETLAELKYNGKIRAYGMSTKTIAGGLLTVALSDAAMVTFHPAYTLEREVIVCAHEKQKGIFIKKALAGGHLQQLSGADPVKESLQFILAEPGVTSVIIGTVNPAHLQEAAAAVS